MRVSKLAWVKTMYLTAIWHVRRQVASIFQAQSKPLHLEACSRQESASRQVCPTHCSPAYAPTSARVEGLKRGGPVVTGSDVILDPSHIMALVPIASLSPDISPPPGVAIRAIITLLWPYSSSTQKCALLLADPDFRLRNHQGQIRVLFTGLSAKAVAQSRVQIGDEVVLALDGSTWARRLEVIRTPGRSVDGELVYDRRLSLRITRPNEEDIMLNIDAASPRRSPEVISRYSIIQTPAPRNAARRRNSSGSQEGVYESPAFAKRLRLSGMSLVDSPYDLFMNDASDADHVRREARQSWRGITHWQYTETSPPSTPSGVESDRESLTRSLHLKTLANTAQSVITQVDGAHDDISPLPSREAFQELSDVSSLSLSRNQQGSEDVLADILHPDDGEPTLPSPASQTKSQFSSRVATSPPEDHLQSRGFGLRQVASNGMEQSEEPKQRCEIESLRPQGLQSELMQGEIELSLPRDSLQDSDRDSEHIQSSSQEQSMAQYSANSSNHMQAFLTDNGVRALSEEVHFACEVERREDVGLSPLPARMERSASNSLDQAYGGDQDFDPDRQSRSNENETENVITECDDREDRVINLEEAGALHSSTYSRDGYQQDSALEGWAAETATPQTAALSYHRSVFPSGHPSVSTSPAIRTPNSKSVNRSTPSSEKQQMMAQTFRSLFGFRSPERQVDDTESRESPGSNPVVTGTVSTAVQTFLEATSSPSRSVNPQLLLDEIPADITIQPGQSLSAEADSILSRSLIPTSEASSPTERPQLELASENTALLLRGLSPTRETHVLDNCAELAYSSPSPVNSPTSATSAEVVTQVEPAAFVTSASLSHTSTKRDEQDFFLTRTIMPPTSIGFSTSQEQALERLFGYSAAQESEFQSIDTESIVSMAPSSKKLRIEDPGFLGDILDVQDGYHPAETSLLGSDELEIGNNENILVDLQCKHAETTTRDVVSSLLHSLDTEPEPDGSRSSWEHLGINSTVIGDSQDAGATRFIEQLSTGHSGGDIHIGNQDRCDQSASTDDNTGASFPRAISASPRPSGHDIMNEPEFHSITGVLEISKPHDEIVGHEDEDLVRTRRSTSHVANTTNLSSSTPQAAAADVQNHEAEAIAALWRDAPPAMSQGSQMVGKHGNSRTVPSSVSRSASIRDEIILSSDERIASQHRDLASSSPVIDTSQELGTELAQGRSAMDWHSPEIADSQSTGDVTKEAVASQIESYTQSAPSDTLQIRRASVYNSTEGNHIHVHSDVELSLDESHNSAMLHYAELPVAEHSSWPESSSLFPVKDDVTTAIVEPGSLITDTTLTSDVVGELGEAFESSSAMSEVDAPVSSDRIHADGIGNETTSQPSGELTVEQSLQSTAGASLLHGVNRQMVAPKLLAARHAAPDSQDASLRAQETHYQNSLATSASGQKLPLTPLNSQIEVGDLEQAHVTSIHTDSNNIVSPPTPQLTQGLTEVLSAKGDHGNSDLLSREPLDSYRQTSPITQIQAERTGEGVAMATPKQANARKSLSNRLSYVPEVISAWFSPRRIHSNTSSVGVETRSKGDEVFHAHEQGFASVVSSHEKSSYEGSQDFLTSGTANGITTSFGYYHSLASIERLLNPPSQQAFSSNHIDIIALVTEKTSSAERAKSGPRDFFTVFKVHDLSLPDAEDVRVEVFRPWRAKLPEADIGDVVLLRSFIVKSRKRASYLLSTDTSAWCVWRYADVSADRGRKDKPVWARRVSDGAGGMVREETKGPQLEFGDEERQYVRALRATWLHTSGMNQG
nr:hypothetical protein CFP56_29855 [Quercus suber]